MKGICNLFQIPIKSKYFYRFLISYFLVIIAILSILSMVVYRYFLITLQEEVESSNLTALIQVRELLDSRMKELNNMTVQISDNNLLSAGMLNQRAYKIYTAVNELKKVKSGNTFLYDIALYHTFYNDDIVYTSKGSFNVNIFFNNIYNFPDFKREDLEKFINDECRPVIYPSQPVTTNGVYNTDLIIYISPVPPNNIRTYSAVMYFIDKSEVIKILSNTISNYNAFIYILDEYSQPIVQYAHGDIDVSHEECIENINVDDLSHSISNMRINDKDLSICMTKSDYNNWTYVSVMNKQEFLSNVYTSRKYFNYAVAGIFIVGIIIAFILTKSNYRPIRQISDLLHDQENNLESHNEFDFINNRILKLVEENKTMVYQLKSRTGLAKEYFILLLLKGKLSNKREIREMMESLNIEMKFNRFVVMLLLIDNFEALKQKVGSDDMRLMIFSIKNVVEELSLDIGNAYCAELLNKGGIALLLNIKDDFDKEEYYYDIAFKTKEFFNKYYSLMLSVGISRTYNDIIESDKAYNEAEVAVEHRLILGGNNIVFYKDVKDDVQTPYINCNSMEIELFTAIKLGEESRTENAINELFKYMKNNLFSVKGVKLKCFELLNMLLKTLDEIGIEDYVDKTGDLFIDDYETIDQLQNELVAFCKNICNEVCSQKESKNVVLRDQILDYIDSHFCDYDISLSTIADRFAVSTSYLSRYFKNQTGQSLMSYIDDKKMDKVKELLINTDMSMKEILFEVGFGDQSNFSRKFKKREGITPIQYREIYSNAGEKEKAKKNWK